MSRDTVPAEEEIKVGFYAFYFQDLMLTQKQSMSTYLTKLETYPDLEGSIIRATKIHKVLKAMIRLSSIPKDEDHQFKKRSHELLAKWNKILQEDPSAADKDDDAKGEDVTINGVNKDVEEQATMAEAGEAAAPEEEKKEDLEKRIGTTVEGEKGADEKITSAEAAEAKATEAPETDEPDVDSAPEKEYQPPAETLEATA